MTNNTNNNPMSAIIAGVLKDEATSLNRSASLVALMFEAEATYSIDAIMSVMRLEGTERTTAIDKELSDISPEFVGTIKALDGLKEIKSTDRTETQSNTIETINKQLRAARMMFTRAQYAVYGLRINDASEVKSSARKIGSLAVEYIKERTGNKIKTVDKEQTVSELIRVGETMIKEKLGKKSAAKAKNPTAGNSLADSSKALAATLTGVVNSNDPKRFDMITDNKELETNVNTILASVLKLECTDDKGVYDFDALSELVSKLIGKDIVINAKQSGKKAA